MVIMKAIEEADPVAFKSVVTRRAGKMSVMFHEAYMGSNYSG